MTKAIVCPETVKHHLVFNSTYDAYQCANCCIVIPRHLIPSPNDPQTIEQNNEEAYDRAMKGLI